MLRYTPIAAGVSVLLLVTGCERAAEPADKGADKGADASTVAAEDSEGRIRITLNADGTVYKVEGRITPPDDAPLGDWLGPLKETETDPASAGDVLATIEVRSFLPNPSDEAHSHGGGQDYTGIPHCHVWVYVGTQRRLVHC